MHSISVQENQKQHVAMRAHNRLSRKQVLPVGRSGKTTVDSKEERFKFLANRTFLCTPPLEYCTGS